MSLHTPTTEQRLRQSLGDALRLAEPMRHHTTFRIGGPAEYFVAPTTPDDLVRALQAAHAAGIEVHLVGGGSNLLVSDAGLSGLTVVNRCADIEFDGRAAQVGGGADFLGFIESCRDRSLAGLAYASGIPGSVGGAVYGNAGCYGQDIGTRMLEATIATLDGVRVRTERREWFEFGYRDSRLKREAHALVSCVIELEPGDRAAIQSEMEEKLQIRRVKHPQWRVEPTAGSYFKNLPPGFQVPGLPHSPGTHRIPAGALLDQCECRGLRVGDAMVFEKHANILVNAGHATATDVLSLAEIMKARVRERFGVELEEEVMFLGPRPDLSAVRGQTA